MRKPLSVFNVLLFSILVTGCATYQKPDWSQYKGPGKVKWEGAWQDSLSF